MAFEFPIAFKDFIKDPIKGVLFLSLIAIMYLYIDNKVIYKEEIKKQDKRIELLENKVTLLENKLLEIHKVNLVYE